jgi:hypothetical protein
MEPPVRWQIRLCAQPMEDLHEVTVLQRLACAVAE